MNGFLALALMILLALSTLGLSVLVLRKNRNRSNFEFDERQLQAKGQASSLALLVGMVYCILLVAFLPDQISGEAMRVLLLLGITLTVMTGCSYAILSDAYVGRSETMKGTGLGFLIFGIGYLILFVLRLVLLEDVISLDNSAAWRSLLMGVGFGYPGVLLLIKDKRSRKEEADGEE